MCIRDSDAVVTAGRGGGATALVAPTSGHHVLGPSALSLVRLAYLGLHPPAKRVCTRTRVFDCRGKEFQVSALRFVLL